MGAALAFALQVVFKNFVWGLLVIITSMFRIGDLISIDNPFGNVIDIGLMSTTLIEIRGWVSEDQQSGCLFILPNGLVINHAISNYTRRTRAKRYFISDLK